MTELIVGLAGNPNVGKTTVFNRLTGMRQHVGNWPGKTVERAEGRFSHGSYNYEVMQPFLIEDHAARAGGSLIYRDDIFLFRHDGFSLSCSVSLLRRTSFFVFRAKMPLEALSGGHGITASMDGV